jgi:hypothetical protein
VFPTSSSLSPKGGTNQVPLKLGAPAFVSLGHISEASSTVACSNLVELAEIGSDNVFANPQFLGDFAILESQSYQLDYSGWRRLGVRLPYRSTSRFLTFNVPFRIGGEPGPTV